MKIGTRLGIAFGFSILITIIVGTFVMFEMQTLADLTESMYDHPLAVSNSVRDIKADIIAMHRSMKDVALAENIEQIDEAAAIVNQYEQQVYSNFDIVFDRFLGDISEVKYAQQVFSEWKVIREEVIELSRQNRKIEAVEITKGKGAGMSHELRTPLNAILGFSQILEGEFEGKLNKTQKNYVRDILGSGKHLLSLINDILDLSKIEEGKSDLQLETLNIKFLLNNSLIMIRERCINHSISLNLDLDESLENIEVTADSRKVKQIMYNLLSNAVKFTPDNGSILVEASKSSEFMEVCITDSGIGIEKEDQKKRQSC